MATIRERTWTNAKGTVSKRWQVDFVDQDGCRRHKQFHQKKAADAWLVKARSQVAAGTFTPDSSSATIRDAADLWLNRAQLEEAERSTITDYERSVAIISDLIDPATRLARLTTPRCEELRDDLLRDHSRPMAQRTLKHFKAIVAGAQRRGLIAHNPAASTRIGTAERHKARLAAGINFPTPEELRAILEAANHEALALICLAALAGMRASEIRGLRWSDVELGQRPAVTIRQRADRFCRIGSPKSSASRRTIPLSETSAQALRVWKLAQPPGRSLVFGTSTDRPDSLSNIRRSILAPTIAAAGVRCYGLHALRHYAVSSWLAAGLDLKLCQRWAGHADLATTINIYGHFIPLRDEHQQIADAERSLFGRA
jgi:integrase